MRTYAVAALSLCLAAAGFTPASHAQFADGTSFTLPPPPPTPTSSCFGCGGGGGNVGGNRGYSGPRPAPPPTKRDLADPEIDAGQTAESVYETSKSPSDYNTAEWHLKQALAYIPGWGPAEESLCELYIASEEYGKALAACQIAAGRTNEFKGPRVVKKWLDTNRIPWLVMKMHEKDYNDGVAAYRRECGSSGNENLNNGITALENGGPGVVDMSANSDAQVARCKQTRMTLFAQNKALTDEVAAWKKQNPVRQ